MERFLHFKKLNQSGFDHILMAVVFILVIGVSGTYYLISTHAESAPWTGGLELASTNSGGKCMAAQGEGEGDYVSLANCSNTVSQKWLKEANGTWNGDPEFTIETDAAGTFQCLDDWQQSTSTHQNWVRLYPCSSGSFATDFVWWGSDHQLKNRASGLCIDDYQNNTAAGTKLDFYTCKSSNPTNQNWFEVSNSASPSSGTSNSGGSGSGGGTTSTSSTTGEIKASIGTNMCVAQAGSEIALETCNGGATQEWTQPGTASGSPTEQFKNKSSGNYIGAANQNSGTKITGVTAASDWTAADLGNSMNSLAIGAASLGNPCLDAPNSSAGTQLQLATCNSGSANQHFTLPTPYTTGSGGGSSTSSSNSGAGGSSTTSSGSSATAGSNSGTTTTVSNTDLSSLFKAIKSTNPSFNCNSLHVSNNDVITQCKTVFQ